MEEFEKMNEAIDRQLKELEYHTPSMRFSKDVLEKVKLETNLIKEEKTLLPWIPKLCIAGFTLLLVMLTVVLFMNNSTVDISQNRLLVQVLSAGLIGSIGIITFFGFDKMIKKLVVQ